MAMIEVKVGEWNGRPLAGEYNLDVRERPFNADEWRVVKNISGYLPMTMAEGLVGLDPDLIIAWACIAMARSGKVKLTAAPLIATMLQKEPWDGSAIVINFGNEEDDEDEEEEEAGTKPTDPSKETRKPKRSGGSSSRTT